jgi:hypothetical protein
MTAALFSLVLSRAKQIEKCYRIDKYEKKCVMLGLFMLPFFKKATVDLKKYCIFNSQ